MNTRIMQGGVTETGRLFLRHTQNSVPSLERARREAGLSEEFLTRQRPGISAQNKVNDAPIFRGKRFIICSKDIAIKPSIQPSVEKSIHDLHEVL